MQKMVEQINNVMTQGANDMRFESIESNKQTENVQLLSNFKHEHFKKGTGVTNQSPTNCIVRAISHVTDKRKPNWRTLISQGEVKRLVRDDPWAHFGENKPRVWALGASWNGALLTLTFRFWALDAETYRLSV